MVVHLDAVYCRYGDQPVLDNVNLRISRGEMVGIVGPSGAGKTTLLKVILGGVRPVAGRVLVGDPATDGPEAVKIGYVPQVETVDWSFPVTAEQVAMMGRCGGARLWPWPSREDRRKVADVMDRLGLAGMAHKHISELSGGQQQRIFLARALASEPSFLIMDEPTSALDPGTRDELLALLEELNRQGMTILLTTHELTGVAARLSRVVCVNRTILADGSPQEVLTPECLEREFGLAGPEVFSLHGSLAAPAHLAGHSSIAG